MGVPVSELILCVVVICSPMAVILKELVVILCAQLHPPSPPSSIVYSIISVKRFWDRDC